MKKKLKVIELFAGVGGFRLGLEGWKGKSPDSGYEDSIETFYKVVWSNQYEPSTPNNQHASKIYEARWGKQGHSNDDIAKVDFSTLPNFDLLVGGFPCQDYSVATTLKNSKGLKGEKGVLWWSIEGILEKVEKKPHYLLLENVDRLLISPAKQRGRDFAIILQCLNKLGYAVEWRVINAADYGMPQRRRRVFFFGYHSSSNIYKQIKKDKPENWIMKNGLMAETFPIISDHKNPKKNQLQLEGDIVNITDNFNNEKKKEVFFNSGVMINGKVMTMKTKPVYNGKIRTLKSIIYKRKVPEEFYIDEKQKEKWDFLKESKSIERTSKQTGEPYFFKEGTVDFPDSLDKPSRTIITGEGGPSPSRFKHGIQTKNGLRRLVPIELERLNMFPDNHTKFDGVTDAKRAFFMGNALVVGVVEKLGETLKKRVDKK